MDRTMLREHLAQAERHVAEGARHIARQRQIIGELAGDAHDIQNAQSLLELYEKMQLLHIAERDLILRELGQDTM